GGERAGAAAAGTRARRDREGRRQYADRQGARWAQLTIAVPDNVRVMNFVKASLADIKPNSYIGVTAMPQPDGSQKAIAIHIFLAQKQPDGTLQAQAVNVGKGIAPPM